MENKKTISLQYYALLREKIGEESENFVTEAETPEGVYEELKIRYELPFSQEMFSVAINDEFGNWQAELKEGDSLAFLPPISGG